jgi:hypothetical protein
VKSVGGGTSVLTLQDIKQQGKTLCGKELHFLYVTIKKTSEYNRIAIYQSLPLKWP